MPSQRKYSGTRSIAARKVVAAQLPAPCTICHRIVTDQMQWQADHITPRVLAEAQGWEEQDIDSPSNLGPAHRSCNESSGAKLGNFHRTQPKAATARIPKVQRPTFGFFLTDTKAPAGAPSFLSPEAAE